LVAFSKISMASVVEVKVESKSIILVSDVCDEIAQDTYYMWVSRGFGEELSRNKAREAREACRQVKKVTAA
jgi:hypothetical protein